LGFKNTFCHPTSVDIRLTEDICDSVLLKWVTMLLICANSRKRKYPHPSKIK